MSVSQLPTPVDSPLLALLEQQRAGEKSYLRDAQLRSDLRNALWMKAMLDPDIPMNTRLHASELSAKADGEFDKGATSVAATIREMFLSPHNRIRETFPALEVALEAADAAAEAEFELVEDDELTEPPEDGGYDGYDGDLFPVEEALPV